MASLGRTPLGFHLQDSDPLLTNLRILTDLVAWVKYRQTNSCFGSHLRIGADGRITLDSRTITIDALAEMIARH